MAKKKQEQVTNQALDLVKEQMNEFGGAIQEMEESFYDIPFGNSAFQNEQFVINGGITPQRAYRSVGLRAQNRIQALKESYYSLRKEDVDIMELEEEIKSDDTNKFEKMRKEIDLEQKLENRKYTKKLINDAMEELKTLYGAFKQLPKYDRKQFEDGEREYFKKSLTRQTLGVSGALESLDNMGEDITKLEKASAVGLPKVMEVLKDGKLLKSSKAKK